MLYMIFAIIILLLLVGIFAYLLYRSTKKNRKLDQEIETLMNMKGIVAKVENEKTDIRTKQNEKENDIIDNPKFDNGVMPINATKKSGSYRDRGGKGGTSNS